MPDTIKAPRSERAGLETVEWVAEYTNLPESFVYRLAREGRIPAVKLGKYVRFPRVAVEQWVAEQGRPR